MPKFGGKQSIPTNHHLRLLKKILEFVKDDKYMISIALLLPTFNSKICKSLILLDFIFNFVTKSYFHYIIICDGSGILRLFNIYSLAVLDKFKSDFFSNTVF